MNTSEKGAYNKPQLKRIGSFEEITQATASGGYLDGNYPTDTPVFGHTHDLPGEGSFS